MLAVAVGCLLSACSGEMFAPDSASPVSANVVTTSAENSHMSIRLRDSTLKVGDTTSLSVVVRDRFGRNVSRFSGLKIRSSDPTVASVTPKGVVTILGAGETWVVVRATGGYSDSISVAVTEKTISAPVSSAPDTGRVIPLDSVRPPALPPALPPELPPVVLSGVVPPFNEPMLPAATVNVTVPSVTGRTVRVAAGDPAALQAALNGATGGDEIVLPNSSVFTGNFVLPKHAGSRPVILRSESVPTAAGTRVTPSSAATYARLVTAGSQPALTTAMGSTGWRVIGVRLELQPGSVDNYGVVRLGRGDETALDQFPSEIVLDRVLITGGTEGSTSRCVAINGSALAVIDSWLIECHHKGRDAQGVAGWSGQGPYLIENNHIEASGEHISFGGGDPKIVDVTPSDITIRRNHLFRPMAWANGRWLVKNIFELKHARRLLFEGNVLENNWTDGQVGFAILFQAVSQDATAPWTVIQDITIRNNIIKNSTSGINILSRLLFSGMLVREPTRRVLLKGNLFLNVGTDPVSGTSGRFVQLLSDLEDVTIIQNTFTGTSLNASDAIMMAGDPPMKRLTVFNNVFGLSQYGLMGSGTGEGAAAVARSAPGAMVQGNSFVGRSAASYPAGNTFPASLSVTDFVNAAAGDYTLRTTLPFSFNAGALVGVNGPALLNATLNTVTR